MHNGEAEQQRPFYFVIRQLTENILPLLYNSVVQPLFKCCVSVLEKKIERIQWRVMKMIRGTENLSYEERFKKIRSA